MVHFRIDLHVELGGHIPKRAGLEAALRAAIANGRVPLGSKMPSTRALARDLGIARGTVVEAYAQLLAEGIIESQRGSGTRVRLAPTAIDPSLPPEALSGLTYDLRPGTPDLSLFPRSRWLAATRKVLQNAPDSAFGRTENRGRIELRNSLANYLGRARGVYADPGRIIIGNGFAGLLPVVVRALADSGVRRAFFEDPCIPEYRQITSSAGLDVLPLRVDQDGAMVETLPADGPSVVVVTPAHQYPLGGTLHPDRRRMLVRWAAATGSTIVEDDYDGEFRYDRQPVGALQGLNPANVVYAGTASKTLAPGLRLGWLVLPQTLIEPTLRAKRQLGAHAGILEQLVLAEFIDSGAYDRHIRKTRQVYRQRREFVLEQLATATPWISPAGVSAGLHMVLRLPPGASEGDVLALAARHQLAVQVLGPTWHDPEERQQALVIGLAAPPAHAFPGAVRALIATLSELNAQIRPERRDRSPGG